MKRAYLFGAAALLILLIVVAYVSFSREKEDVCVRPPPPVGPRADPDILTLITPDQHERLLRLRDALDDDSKDVVPLNADESTSRKLFADGGVMSTDELNERLQGLRGPPTGGPLPVDPLLQSDPCEAACRPKTPKTPYRPYTPKPKPNFGDSPVVSLDRLSALQERQRQRTNEWAANLRAKTLQTPTPPRRLQTPPSQERAVANLIDDMARKNISAITQEQSPILPRLRGADRSPTPSDGEFCAYAESQYYPPPYE